MFVIDRSLYLSPEVVVEPRRCAPLEVKEDPFSLEALVAWLERQPGEKKYDPDRPAMCLLGQYVVASGGRHEPFVYILDGQRYSVVSHLGDDSLPADAFRVAMMEPNTFGAALSRARKLLAEREK